MQNYNANSTKIADEIINHWPKATIDATNIPYMIQLMQLTYHIWLLIETAERNHRKVSMVDQYAYMIDATNMPESG